MTEYIIEIKPKSKPNCIEIIPTLGEEVVRCGDCYFVDEIEGGYWCDRFDCGREHVTPDGFCAWGERR